MTTELTLIAGLLMGLMGSGHCLGMCGGIMSAFSLGVSENDKKVTLKSFFYMLGYNLGRISSYAVAGFLVGLIGQTLMSAIDPAKTHVISQLIAGSFLLLTGLYIAGWWRGLLVLEKAGQKLWKYVQPFTKAILPIDSPLKSYTAGLVWGWLPCGLVYSALAWSMASGTAVNGAILMASFGVGTLPMLMATGLVSQKLGDFTRHKLFRSVVGGAMIVVGIFMIIGQPLGHNHAKHAGHMGQEGHNMQGMDHSGHEGHDMQNMDLPGTDHSQ